MNFKERVFEATKKIPKGRVSTYKEVACFLSKPKAYRAVGNILNKNENKLVPCHRVIRSDGLAGGFNLGNKEKIKKLKTEGIEVKDGRINLEKYLYEF